MMTVSRVKWLLIVNIIGPVHVSGLELGGIEIQVQYWCWYNIDNYTNVKQYIMYIAASKWMPTFMSGLLKNIFRLDNIFTGNTCLVIYR